MKPNRFIFSIFFFLPLFFICQNAHATAPDKGKLVIVITNQTTSAQLDSIKKVVSAQGGELDIDGAVFSQAGQLKKISGSIYFSEKQNGKFSSDTMGTITITKKGAGLKIDVQAPPAQK